MYKKIIRALIIINTGLIMIACDQTADMQPPVAKKIPAQDTLFNEVRIDNYYWLRDKSNPEVINYLEAENAYTEAMMEHTEDLQDQLYKEMLGRIKETDLSVPVEKDGYFYYSRTEQGKQYKSHCRKKGSLDAEEEIILDENELAAGHEYFNLGVFEISPDHKLLAFSVDTTGGEAYTVYVKNLQTGRILEDEIPNTYYSLAWASDNKTFFYTVLDHAKRPYQVYRHKLDHGAADDKLVYHEEDDRYFVDIERTKSGGYILINLNSIITTEVRFLKADDPEGKFKIFQSRKEGVEYEIDHHSRYFYFLINEGAMNFKLMRTPVNKTEKKYWQTVLAHDPKIKLDNIDLFEKYMVIYLRENGLRGIHVCSLKNGRTHKVAFPEPVYTFRIAENPEFDTQWLRFSYMSFVTPPTVYDFNMKTHERVLKKQKEVPGGYDPENYIMQRLFAEAKDGTKIPISLVYRKNLTMNGENPLLLYGYGSYGSSREPNFSSNIFSLIDRGFVYAIAHVRGGGEMGRYWYEEGKLLNKKNTFFDFIACAEHLIENQYTGSEKLVIRGGSAGGLLMGAVTNLRPDLFEVVIAHVPFVDVINTMLDESIPLTVIEYDEWGNPAEEEYYHYIKSYSPYDNLKARDYPDMLITAGLNDPRVQYWEPAKFTARLRALKTDNNLQLLKVNMGAGHGGASGRYDYLEEVAFEYAFILDRLNMVKQTTGSGF